MKKPAAAPLGTICSQLKQNADGLVDTGKDKARLHVVQEVCLYCKRCSLSSLSKAKQQAMLLFTVDNVLMRNDLCIPISQFVSVPVETCSNVSSIDGIWK